MRRPVESGQFTSLIFTRRCRSVGIDISMGSRGDCFDNAVLESFHASLKKDLIHRRSWPTKAEARTAVFGYIESLQPPAPRFDARDVVARGVRERNSQDRRCQSRRFAARIPQQDGIQVNVNGPSRLTTPCPPNRGRSSSERRGVKAARRNGPRERSATTTSAAIRPSDACRDATSDHDACRRAPLSPLRCRR